MKKRAPYILWFEQIGIEDVPLVGGKNASLGEMYSNLKKKKVEVPPGFAITAAAYRYVLEKSGAFAALKKVLTGLKHTDPKDLIARSEKAREIVLGCEIPADLQEEIRKAYQKLGATDVAVRSSATAEDLPSASFAGQQESYLNIVGEKELLIACKKCFASLFTSRAIAYRCEQKIDHLSISLSIGVQKMVRSDLAQLQG